MCVLYFVPTMSSFSSLRIACLSFAALIVSACVFPYAASAAVCSITTDTVVNAQYVVDNSCDAIEINGNVSTTWIGTVSLPPTATVTVKTGFTMTMGSSSAMVLGALNDLIVETGAAISHTAGDPSGINITARNITVTGAISANGKGCWGGPANEGGYGPDLITGECTQNASGAGGYRSAGGSYGGHGTNFVFADGIVRDTYGAGLTPTLLGSAGGSGTGGSGSAGGGRIRLIAAGTLTVGGSVTANGANADSHTGGGSGGSVYIAAGVLEGGGSITANGGHDGSGGGGAGGGGRVAIYFGTIGDFSAEMTASGASTSGWSGFSETAENGSVVALNRTTDDGAGTLMIMGDYEFIPEEDYARDRIEIAGGIRLRCATSTSLTVTGGTSFMDGGSTWICDNVDRVTVGGGNLSTTAILWSFSNATSVHMLATTSWSSGDASSTMVVPLTGSQTTWSLTGAVNLTNFHYVGGTAASSSALGGVLQIDTPASLSLFSSTILASVSSTYLTGLAIDADSSIDASGKGCIGGVAGVMDILSVGAYGPNPSTGICGLGLSGAGTVSLPGSYRGGGAYGGTGGSGEGGGSAQATTYGSPTLPTNFGSGGAYGNMIGQDGGMGGGLVFLSVAGAVTINGTIKSDGQAPASFGGGGGSGGTVYLTATGHVEGSGTITANGERGYVAPTGGGGGGGGRIAVYYGSRDTFSIDSLTANGGLAGGGGTSEAGGAGTIEFSVSNVSPNTPSSLNPSDLTNGSTTSTNTPTFSFNLSDPDGADTVKYRIIVDDTSNFSSPVVDYTSGLAAQGTRTFQVGQAAGSGAYATGSESMTLSDGTYYWEVRAIDGSDAVSSYTLARGSGLAAFLVDAVARTIQFETTTGSGLESVTASSARIVLNTASFEDITVNYAVTGGTATGGGTDYTLASGTATIPAGETSTTTSFTVVNDSILEGNETFVVTLSSPSHASLGSNTTYTYTITDNETASISVTPTALSLTRGGAAGSYTVTLGAAPTNTVQILLSTAPELTLSTSTLTFTGGTWDTPQTVTVSPRNDGSFDSMAITHVITHTVSTTITGFAALTPSSVTVTLNAASSSGGTGGGGGGIGAGGGSSIVASGFAPIANPTPVTTVTFLTPPAPEAPAPAPTFEPLPNTPGLLTVVNPRDIEQVVERFNQGQRDEAREQVAMNQLQTDLRSFRLATSDEQQIQDLATFISYGLTEGSARLGSGERRAVVRDALETLRTTNLSPADLERLVHGQIPQARNLTEERRQATRALATFRTIYGHAPNFQNAEENLAWNTLMYRIRFPRNLEAETQGIQEFRATFHRTPQDPFQWATVRVMGYVNR